MQGRHEYQPELFAAIDIENLIPKNHLLRRIDRVLNLEFLRNLTAPLYSQDQGRPSVDPEIFVRMVLLQALYNIDADRQLCEEVGYNLAYRWFCRLSLKDKVPDHSSITRIRDRLGEKTYEAIFREVLEQCRKVGLIKAEQVMMDGSYIKANASLYRMVERDKKNDKSDDDSAPPPSASTNREQIHSKDGLSNNDLRKHQILGKRISNKTHVNPADPEASLSGKHGEYKSLQYKTHHMIDASSRVILDCHVTTGSISDVTKLPERVDHVEKIVGLKLGEVIADRGYGSGENLKFLHAKGIKTNIPLWSTRVGKMFGKENPKFRFDEEKGEMICPEGQQMHRVSQGEDMHAFALSAHTCRACPLYETCVTEPQKRQRRGKIVRVHKHQAIYTKVLEQEKDPIFRKKLWQRMWKMEGIFAEGKAHHGLKRARYRGRWKVQTQVYVISVVQNLKRLAGAVVFVFRFVELELAKLEFGAEKLSICRI